MNLERDKVRREAIVHLDASRRFPTEAMQDLKSDNVASAVANDHVTMAMSLPKHVFSSAIQRY